MPITPAQVKAAVTFNPETVRLICAQIDSVMRNSHFVLTERLRDGQRSRWYWNIRLDKTCIPQITQTDIAEVIRSYRESGWDDVEEIQVPEDRGDPGYTSIRLYSDDGFF